MTRTTLTRSASPQIRLARSASYPNPAYRSASTHSIAMDAERDESEVRLSFELAGLSSADVDVTVEKNVLTVTAEVPERQSDARVIAAERKTGTLRRQLVLGEELDGSSVEAAMSNGVLTLTVAVAEKAKPFSVTIADTPDGDSALPVEASESAEDN